MSVAQNALMPSLSEAAVREGRTLGRTVPRTGSELPWPVRRVMVADALAAVLASVPAVALGGLARAGLTIALVIPVAWCVALSAHRAYERRALEAFNPGYRQVLQAGVTLVALTGTALIVTGSASADVVLGAAAASAVATLGLRGLVHRRVVALRRAGIGVRRAVLVGGSDQSAAFLSRLSTAGESGVEIVSVCITDEVAPDELPVQVRLLAGFTDVDEAVDRTDADALVLLPSASSSPQELRRLIWRFEDRLSIGLVPGLLDVASRRVSVGQVHDFSLLTVDSARGARGRLACKHAADRALAALGLVLLSPFFAVIAVLIRVTSEGPAIYRQRRVGGGGHEFTMLKFRTMSVDADARLDEVSTHNEHDGLMFKIAEDPRLTRLGVYLRRYSLDELPQLWNVLRGHMSLVGPRPSLPEEVARYVGHVRRRLLVRPGLTGLWQISGRSDLTWEETVRLDLSYVDNWSIGLDLSILWRTAGAVVYQRGAY
jgi:exopolysaccharide biosynthesis polyprenyl glycosylphosphotransferase